MPQMLGARHSSAALSSSYGIMSHERTWRSAVRKSMSATGVGTLAAKRVHIASSARPAPNMGNGRENLLGDSSGEGRSNAHNETGATALSTSSCGEGDSV